MADAAVKKPVGGAYGTFMNEKREEFKKQAAAAGDKTFGGPAKLASAAWKAKSDAEKAPYQKRYEEAKAKWDAYKDSDDYVAPEKKAKKEEKGKKDKDAPKRPAGGAYGAFMNEKRAEFQQKAKESGDTSFAGPTKLGSAAWKAMGEEEKAKYEAKYQAAKAKYEEDLAAYKASKSEETASSPEKASPGKSPAKAKAAKASPKAEKAAGKRKAEASPTQPAQKKGRPAKGPAAALGLSEDVLKMADGMGLRSGLENLAGRKDVADKRFEGSKLLEALQAADGLVNKAKAALLGGA